MALAGQQWRIPCGIGPVPCAGPAAAASALALCDPLMDMRVAAWMATPEDKRLKDDAGASLGGKDAPYTVEALLRWAVALA